jgi:hypothetical protein
MQIAVEMTSELPRTLGAYYMKDVHSDMVTLVYVGEEHYGRKMIGDETLESFQGRFLFSTTAISFRFLLKQGILIREISNSIPQHGK